MRSSALLRANVGQTWRRYKAILGALAVGSALLVGASAVIGDGVRASADHLSTESSLSVLTLRSTAPAGEPARITGRSLEGVRALPGVQAVVGTSSVGAILTYVKGGSASAEAASGVGFGGVFFALPRFEWSQPPLSRTDAAWDSRQPLGVGEILLPSSQFDTDLAPLLGATVTIEYTQTTGPGQGQPAFRQARVVGLFDNTDPRSDGDAALYVGEADYSALLAAQAGSPQETVPREFEFQKALVKADSVASAGLIAATLADRGFYVEAAASEGQQLPRAIEMLRSINLLFAVVLGAFALGIGATLGSTWSRLRRWDVAVLVSLGWSRRSVVRSYLSELLIVGLAVGLGAALLGAVLAVVGGPIVVRFSDLGLEPGIAVPSVAWLGPVILGTPLALALGAGFGVARLGALDVDAALRSRD